MSDGKGMCGYSNRYIHSDSFAPTVFHGKMIS